MSARIWIYVGLAALWLAFAVAILLGYHELIPGLGKAEDWKKFLAAGLCLLMFSFNLARIYLIRQADKRARAPHA